MKAVALTGLGRLEALELPNPAIQLTTEALVKIERVGICGSDLHYYETGRIGTRVVRFPFVLGHECSGVVVETGAGVQRVRAGDRVAVDPAISCQRCDQCRQGRPHTCRNLRFLGCPGEASGCLCEYIVMPEDCLYPVPDTVTPERAALCEPMSIGVYAVRQGRLRLGSLTAVLGAGPIGLCVLLAARRAGATLVLATDRVPARLAAAGTAGACWTGNPDQQDVVVEMRRLAPEGLDVVFECAGQQETLDQAVALLKPGGTIVIVGIPRSDRVSFPIDALRRKELTLVNLRRQNQCVAPAIGLLAAGSIKADFLVSHVFAPAQAGEGFELVAGYHAGVLKAMIRF